MEYQESFFEENTTNSDIVYTPRNIAKKIVELLKPSGLCLDPCKGDGAFFDFMPNGSEWCEVAQGRNFFDYHKSIDWVIGNPPYSIFDKFLEHSFNISDNVSFLVPTNKVFQRQYIMDLITSYGGIRSMIVFGSGTSIGFPFGFSVGNFHFQRNYNGTAELILGLKSIFSNI